MDNETILKEIERLGELLKKPIAEYKKSLQHSYDFDETASKLQPVRETLEKIVRLVEKQKT